MTNLKDKQQILDIYNDYAHNRLTRHEFIQKLSAYAVGGVTLNALLSFLMPNYAKAQQVSPNDERIVSEYRTYDSPKGGGSIKGLFCMPANSQKKLGAVIVVHENRGLNPYIEDVARRLAVAGYMAFAPDALSPLGGYPGNDDQGREMQAKRNRDEILEDFIAAYHFIKKDEKCNGKVGVVGFCFGGWISNMFSVLLPDLACAVPFYGSQAAVEDVPKIKAPLLFQFAEKDERVNEGWITYEKALKQHGKPYEVYQYAGTNHGFHNDTTPRYDKEAAELAWKRTLAFFDRHLK